MIYDISPPINEHIAVWPGDLPYTRMVQMSLEKGDHLTLSGIQTSLHLGAHADAPNHTIINGTSIGEQDLNFYVGSCQVVSITNLTQPIILPEYITSTITEPRVLFCTNTFTHPQRWTEHFACLCPETIDVLYEQGVILAGIDTPSIDTFDSKTLPTHKRMGQYSMAILEGLTLMHVPAGRYELIALPLRLIGADASPVRAILRTLY
jgi:arylformamidase